MGDDTARGLSRFAAAACADRSAPRQDDFKAEALEFACNEMHRLICEAGWTWDCQERAQFFEEIILINRNICHGQVIYGPDNQRQPCG